MTLSVRGVSVALDGRPVLSEVSLEAPGGSWTAVIGPNGAGKSTLMRAMVGLVAYQGEIAVEGRPARGLKPRERARLVAYAPQSPTLPPEMTVLDYVLLGRSPYIPYLGAESRNDRRVAASVLARLDLSDMSGRRLAKLSGGERQRVVLARAIAQEARILLLDEPTSALDLGHQQQVLELVDRLRLADALTVITTLHDLSLAAQYAETMVLLSRGGVVSSGPAAAVLTAETVAEHFGAKVTVSVGGDGRPTMALERP
ncbi:ABC transporter ATP-binding protein [Rhizohabitans arisaemae]|uniref:ABC transporter ATP-binding protein n=1 Tax=Rhizohabitans arisaemae TaxID=2720610 RepID=UPI0024B2103E|nr:ABC transporter ATP-binding protein [Rhizohabitans arisaemae]